MSEGEITQESQTPIHPPEVTRRSFLKVAVLSPLALLAKPETTKPDNALLSIETPEAKYFPIYESHSQPASAEQLQQLPPQDIFLYEYVRDARYFIDPLTSPQIILDTKFTNLSAILDSKRTYIIPRDHLEWLRKNNTKICFEGYRLEQDIDLTELLPMFSENFIGMGGALSLMLLKEKKGEGSKNVVSRRQFLKLVAGLATAWGLSPLAFLIITPKKKTEVKLNALERVIIKAHGLSSQLHPEDPIIFFRNIIFARKLQFLGEIMSKEKREKAQITYNVGKMHAGIEDFLQIGKEWTLAFLNIMPNWYLKAIIDANGGLENFCSDVLFDPNAQNPTKSVRVDEELKNFLNKKLNLSK